MPAWTNKSPTRLIGCGISRWSLQRAVNHNFELKAKEEEERTRKERARQAALAKLSKEERELLGV